MTDPRTFILAHETARKRCSAFAFEAPEEWMVTFQPPKRNGDINAALHAMLGEIAARVTTTGRVSRQ